MKFSIFFLFLFSFKAFSQNDCPLREGPLCLSLPSGCHGEGDELFFSACEMIKDFKEKYNCKSDKTIKKIESSFGKPLGSCLKKGCLAYNECGYKTIVNHKSLGTVKSSYYEQKQIIAEINYHTESETSEVSYSPYLHEMTSIPTSTMKSEDLQKIIELAREKIKRRVFDIENEAAKYSADQYRSLFDTTNQQKALVEQAAGHIDSLIMLERNESALSEEDVKRQAEEYSRAFAEINNKILQLEEQFNQTKESP